VPTLYSLNFQHKNQWYEYMNLLTEIIKRSNYSNLLKCKTVLPITEK